MVNDRRLFRPLKLGNAQLEHRIAMAPLTRVRAPNHVPVERHAIYYAQRATKGGLLITEATFIAPEAGGMEHVPGIHSQEQIEGWKKVTQAVHDKGGIIYMQLWALGRANSGKADVPKVVSASNLAFEGGATPEPMTKEDIERYIEHYRKAAVNAIEAGFDGVEVHSANGYLLQQFIEESSNNRTDEFGGSLENRTRFVKAVLKAVTSAIGEERTGIRLSPWGSFQGMGQMSTPDTYKTYTYVTQHIKDTFPKFSYVHFVEDREAWLGKEDKAVRSCDAFRSVFRKPLGTADMGEEHQNSNETYDDPSAETSPTVFMVASDYKTENSLEHCQVKGDIIAIGRPFISNPDIVERIKNGWEFTPYDRDTFYLPCSDKGYIDYAVHGERGHGEEAAEAKARGEKTGGGAKF